MGSNSGHVEGGATAVTCGALAAVRCRRQRSREGCAAVAGGARAAVKCRWAWPRRHLREERKRAKLAEAVSHHDDRPKGGEAERVAEDVAVVDVAQPRRRHAQQAHAACGRPSREEVTVARVDEGRVAVVDVDRLKGSRAEVSGHGSAL
eukprot:1944837-Prymnesium_polylepis.1